MKLWDWIKNLFRRNYPEIPDSSTPVVVIPSGPSAPEVPTKEEVENFPPLTIDLGKWKGMEIDQPRKSEFESVKNHFLKFKNRYDFVSSICGVPSSLICALHYRESSLSFLGVLHNGEKILGKGRKTSLVPKGRGPFNTWEESAIDALMLKKSIMPSVWTFESMMEFAERFNGLGYRSKVGDSGKIENSPYICAGTNFHDETSKYTSDGKYSKTAKEEQLGVGGILIYIS